MVSYLVPWLFNFLDYRLYQQGMHIYKFNYHEK